MFKKYTITLAGQVLVYVSGFLLIPLIVQTSGTQVYGSYVIVISLLGILTGISSFGSGFSAKRFLPSIDNKEERGAIFYPQFYFHLLSALLLGFITLFFFPVIEKYFLGDGADFDGYLVVLYLIFYILYDQTIDVFRYTHKVNLFNISTTLYPYIFLIIIIFWYRFDETISTNTLIISQIIALAVIFVLMLVPLIKSIGFKFTWYKKHTFIKDIKYGLPLLIVVIFELIISVSDRYVIAGYMNLDSVAFYAIAYSVGSIPFLIPKVIGVVLPPIVSKLKDQGEVSKIAPMVNSAIFVFFMFLLPFTIGFIMLGEPLLSLYVNKETATEAAGLLPIITIAILFYGVGSILSCILFVEMKTKSILFSNSVAGLLNLVANIIIFSIVSDIYVAAWTTFLSYLVYLLLTYRLIGKQYKIELFSIQSRKIVLSALIMMMALFFMKFSNVNFYTIEGLALGLIVGGAVYVVSLFVSKAVLYSDILGLMGKNRNKVEGL